MEKILADINKFIKVTFNSKLKVDKKIQNLFDIESCIKSCFDALFNNNYLFKESCKFLKPAGGIIYGLC